MDFYICLIVLENFLKLKIEHRYFLQLIVWNRGQAFAYFQQVIENFQEKLHGTSTINNHA